jgi:hypothetical protein
MQRERYQRDPSDQARGGEFEHMVEAENQEESGQYAGQPQRETGEPEKLNRQLGQDRIENVIICAPPIALAGGSIRGRPCQRFPGSGH